MNFHEYSAFALTTRSPHNTRDHVMMGLFGEAGEVVDLIKKVVAHGHPIDDALCAKVRKEIGDVLWYVAIGALEDLNIVEREQLILPFGTIDNAELAACARALREDVHAIEDNADFDSYMDILRTLAFTARRFGSTLEQCALENVAKLKARYPDGFSTAASIARADIDTCGNG